MGNGERLRRAVRVSLFNSLWLPVVPRALLNLATRRGPIRYEKMEHYGSRGPVWDESRKGPAGV